MKKYILLLVKISISIVLLYLILKKIDLAQLQISLRHVDLKNLIVGIIVGIVFNLVKFVKWLWLIRAKNKTYTYWDSAKSYMIGNALGIITPMRAGDLGRALYFNSDDRPKIMGFTIIDRLLDLIAVISFCIVGGLVLVNVGFGLALAFITILLVLVIYRPIHIITLLKRICPFDFLNKQLNRLMNIQSALEPSVLTLPLLLSFVSFLLIIFQFYFVVSAFEKTSFLTVYLATPLVTLSSLIPISFMGLGVREGLSVYLFSMMGISVATAFSTAFLCFLINNISTSVIGAIYLSTIKFSSLKN